MYGVTIKLTDCQQKTLLKQNKLCVLFQTLCRPYQTVSNVNDEPAELTECA